MPWTAGRGRVGDGRGSAPVSLLGPFDPHPVRVSNPGGASRFLLVSDHAGRRMPQRLDRLGLGRADRDRHIAYDIGIKQVGALLCRRLDACLIEQRYSRLVIDCNRPPGHPGSIATISEATGIPGNASVDDVARASRESEILAPYHAAIAAALDRRAAEGRETVLVALHSFTPVYLGEVRRWHAGVLHDPVAPRGLSPGVGPGLPGEVLARLRAEGDLVVGDNEPYTLTASSDYTVPLHAWSRALDHVELEVRQDLIDTPAGQAEWAARIARVLATEPAGSSG